MTTGPRITLNPIRVFFDGLLVGRLSSIETFVMGGKGAGWIGNVVRLVMKFSGTRFCPLIEVDKLT